MSKFENKLCPVCRERFHEGDDIAVCPECGTPHHRACYLAAGKCALENLHSTGFVWNGRLPDEPVPVPDIAALIKANKSANEDGADINSDDDEKTLTLLGLSGLSEEEREEFRQLKENEAMRDLLGAIRDNAKGEDGVSMQELIAFTGTSVWHYSRVFNSFRGMTDGKKHYMSFNICSGLFSPIYQFYRRMDLIGVIALVLSVLPSFVIIMTGGGVPSIALRTAPYALLNLVSFLPIVLLCVFGDYLFYLKAVKRIHKIRAHFKGKTDTLEYLKALADGGKPSLARAALGALAMVFANVCIMTLGNL